MDIHTIIGLFPIAFMLHDFEEIIFGEAWLRKNAGEIRLLVKNRIPAFLAGQIDAVFDKTTSELAFPICLIFSLACLSSFLAIEYDQYGFFLIASAVFFLHGFMHLGQSIILRRYVPAAASSILIVIPYGLGLYRRLINAGIIDITGLLIYLLFSLMIVVPFILVMHKVGDLIYKRLTKFLID